MATNGSPIREKDCLAGGIVAGLATLIFLIFGKYFQAVALAVFCAWFFWYRARLRRQAREAGETRSLAETK